MVTSSQKNDYFTKHLFGTGVECPTRLHYYSQGYPENLRSMPFIKHAVYNKRLLKALARSVYPEGIFIRGQNVAKAASKTKQLLDQDEVVLFDAIFEHRQMMGRLPIVYKQNSQLTLFYIQTKAFDSRKHRLADAKRGIYSKWRDYLIDFAYQVYLVRRHFPELELKPFLLLPEKNGQSFTNNLISLLEPLDDHDEAIIVDATNQQLLAQIDVTDLVVKVMTDPSFADEHLPKDTFEDSILYLRELYFSKPREAASIGLKCKECEFRVENDRVLNGVASGFNECWQPHMETDNPSESHLFDLIGPGTQQWIEEEVYDQRNISADNIISPEKIEKGTGRLTHLMRQSLQIHKAKGHPIPEQIIRPDLFEELNRWKYPLHFLDFEAGNYAVPIRKNRSPYDLVIFQFSCHTLYPDGSWKHHQFISEPNDSYPNFELIRALKEVPQIKEGTIVQYSNFERHALKTIRRELIREQKEVPDAEQLIGWLTPIINRNDSSHHESPYVADLSRLVKDFYYNIEMENSLSIKDVLRSVMDHSEFLKKKYSKPYSSENFDDIIWWQSNGEDKARNPYNLLRETGDSPISRGTEAMVVYGKMIARKLTTEERQAYQTALLKYCELDTLAMVMIYQHWQHVMKSQ